jgi:protein TonB
MLSLESLPLSAPTAGTSRSKLTGVVSFGLHAMALVAVVTLPLLLEESLPEQAGAARAFFAGPVSLAPPPPPPPVAAARAVPRVAPPRTASAALFAPVEVPTEIVPEDGLDLGSEGGLPGGVEGGVPGGVVGGVVGGLPDAPPPPKLQPLRVGRDIRAPRKVREVAPVYPELARLSRLEGVVVVECMIDERGRVQDAKVVKSIRLLDEAALEAVRQWAYAPSLLNGVPVPVLMNVTVTFQLAD